jgi:mannose-1-phosphate guanylyltransferase
MSGKSTMIQDAFSRLAPIAAPADIHVSTGAEMGGLVRTQLPDLAEEQLIIEPALRNTGPAVGLECALLEARYPGCTIASLGSDHYIGKGDEFCRLLSVAEAAVEAYPEYLFTIGIKPTRPETGYGYIRKGEVLCQVKNEPVYAVQAFTEKPDLVRAEEYTTSGEYLWNSNMFVWRASTVLALFEGFEPEIYAGLKRIMEAVGTSDEAAAVEREYPQLKEIAVDNAIIEPTDKVATLEGDIDWGDIGSWAALTDVLPADTQGNLLNGPVIALETRNTTAYALKDKVMALIGVEDLVVVDTADALLVCRKDQAQEVKKVLDRLKEEEGFRRFT